MSTCPMCNGIRYVVAAGAYRPCPTCNASGRVDSIPKECPKCEGRGRIIRKGVTGLLGEIWDGKDTATCPRCGGRGVV